MSIAEAHAILTAPGMPFEMEKLVIRGVRTRVWKNAPPTLRAVVEAGRATATRSSWSTRTSGSASRPSSAPSPPSPASCAAQGVAKGDRVAIIMRNLPEWPVAFYAAAALGAIVTPLNAWWTGPELEYGLVDSGAKVAIVDAERLERLNEHLRATAPT